MPESPNFRFRHFVKSYFTTSNFPLTLHLPLMTIATLNPTHDATKFAALRELAKPRLNMLVVITALAGFYLATKAFAGGISDVLLALHLSLGTMLTASGAAALNQWWERDHDAAMPRTRRRPLVSGAITPSEALWFGVALGGLGTLYLGLLVNWTTAGLGLATLLIYLLIYTPMKRRTVWCTLIGAVPGAVPPVMGFAAAGQAWTWGSAALFLILLAWQMPHFWGLAIMYRRDYALGGFKMLPVIDSGDFRRTGRSIVLWCGVLILASLLPGVVGVAGTFYAPTAALLGGFMLAAGLNAAVSPGPREARLLFFTSIAYLPLLLGVLMLTAGQD